MLTAFNLKLEENEKKNPAIYMYAYNALGNVICKSDIKQILTVLDFYED